MSSVLNYFDGNQWHTVADPKAYAKYVKVWEMRVLSGTGGRGQKLDIEFHNQRRLVASFMDICVYYQKPDNLTPPEAQAHLFCDTVGTWAANEAPLFDIEGDVGFNVNDVTKVQAFTSKWLDVVEGRSSRRAMVYVPSALKGSLTRKFLGDRLIKAPHYSAVPNWEHDIHQYGITAIFPGVPVPGDGNRTGLTVQEMKSRLGMVKDSLGGYGPAILEQFMGRKTL